jgi:hypothetical protein
MENDIEPAEALFCATARSMQMEADPGMLFTTITTLSGG